MYEKFQISKFHQASYISRSFSIQIKTRPHIIENVGRKQNSLKYKFVSLKRMAKSNKEFLRKKRTSTQDNELITVIAYQNNA